jgi:protoheme IX farnesyltransferase
MGPSYTSFGSSGTLTRSEPEVVSTPAGARDKVLAYLALTKPRIIELLLITTVPAMILAERGWPSPLLVLATLIGGSLSAGGANAINCYVDRDIDEIMQRTRKRPLPRHVIAPRQAVFFGTALGVLGFAELWWTVNLPAAVLSTAGLLFYVFVYTIGLKRWTPQNIVIGGAAGAVPALVGWAAVTGRVGMPALVMFGLVFYWTPPHFWALAMRYEEEYAAAGVPMMPVVYGRAETAKHILLYTLLLLAMSLLLFSVGHLGLIYLASALVLNAAFIGQAAVLWRRPTTENAWKLFKLSLYFLSLLSAAMVADVVIGA